MQAIERTEALYTTRGARSGIPPSLWTPALDSGGWRALDLEYALPGMLVDRRARTGISCRTRTSDVKYEELEPGPYAGAYFSSSRDQRGDDNGFR